MLINELHIGALVQYEEVAWGVAEIKADTIIIHVLYDSEYDIEVPHEDEITSLPAEGQYLALLGWKMQQGCAYRYQGKHMVALNHTCSFMDIDYPYPIDNPKGSAKADTLVLARVHLFKDQWDPAETGLALQFAFLHELQNFFLGTPLTPLLAFE